MRMTNRTNPGISWLCFYISCRRDLLQLIAYLEARLSPETHIDIVLTENFSAGSTVDVQRL